MESKLQVAAEIEDLLRENDYSATITDVRVNDGAPTPTRGTKVLGYELTVEVDV